MKIVFTLTVMAFVLIVGNSALYSQSQNTGYWANCYNPQTRTTYKCFVQTAPQSIRQDARNVSVLPTQPYEQIISTRFGRTINQPMTVYNAGDYNSNQSYPVDHRQRTTTTRQDIQVDSGGSWGWGRFGQPRVRYRITRIDQNVRIQSTVQSYPPYVRVGTGGLWIY